MPKASLYARKHLHIGAQLAAHIDRGCRLSTSRPLVFFRADDIGIPSGRFEQLIASFQKHRLPLCLATVPAWLTATRLIELRRATGRDTAQWCWHQHGQAHRNFEATGKKQEFGPARTKEEIHAAIEQGRKRLEQLLAADFHPVFTPPWNRCSGETLEALADLNFQAISRSRGARPKTPARLPDYQVNVDLHTRKETDPQLALDHLLTELEEGLASGLCGIMIHHRRMNRSAFALLDTLLSLIKRNRILTAVHFKDLH